MTFGLHTPREVLHEAIKAAKQQGSAAPGIGLAMLYAVRMRILERGLLDMAMTSGAIEALLDEMTDGWLKSQIQPEIDPERIHGKERLQ
jgi:hypothetical protein